MRLRDLPPEVARPIARQVIDAFGTPRLRYVPSEMEPTDKQAVGLCLDRLEVFYGGAAGPGKSWWLMASALQYVDVPGYAAILFRRTFPDLSRPGGLIDMSRMWLGGTDAVYNTNLHTWTFPSGATLSFGHMQYEHSKLDYRGAEFAFMGFDELSTFTETQFTFLFSRLRKPAASRGASPDGLTIDRVPLRMRSASNPGGPGHDWVRERYVDPETRGRKRVFIPAWLHENPHLDQEAYRESLAELSDVEQERLIGGDWDAVDAGGMMDPRTWPTVASFQSDEWLRVWDLAGSKATPEHPDPDWTVGVRLDRDPETRGIYVTDVVRFREDPATTESIVRLTALRDGHGPVGIEQEPGSSGKAVISTYSRTVLQGLASVHAIGTTGDKVARARAVAAAAGRGELTIVRAPWNKVFFSECSRFPFASHDDQVDALAHAYTNIGRLVGGLVSSSPSVSRLPSRSSDRRAR